MNTFFSHSSEPEEVNPFAKKLSHLVCVHPLGTSAKFSEKPGFLKVRIRGLEMLVFRKMLRTFLMGDPY